MYNIRTNFVQEASVVAHYNKGVFVLTQIALEPQHRLEIEMIRRFVKHEHVRLHEQRRGETDSHPPPTRKSAGGAVLHLVRELQSGKDGRRAAFRRRPADERQASVDRIEPLQIGRKSFVFGGALLRLAVLLEAIQYLFLFRYESAAFHVCGQHRGQHASVAPTHLLTHVEYSKVLGEALHLHRRDSLEQGRLPNPILPDQTVPPPIGQLQLRILQYRRPVVQ
mmetsp:Transcript_21095/g.42236  ORF Transcript_21095/g.42236 Transcript_21095/m.42236 type:complete len:223 (-) Transcript_21095:899-1567(-)